MPAKINLIGQRFGKITVLEETSERKNKSVVWRCRCDCGKEIFLSTKELRSDGVIQCPDCGHDRTPKIRRENIIGEKFNHLTVIKPTDKRSGGKIVYLCKCDCGSNKDVYVTRTELISGGTISCGCARRKYSVGEEINNRKIIGYTKGDNNNLYYICKCLFCGREYNVQVDTLDKTISCGCQKSKGEFYIVQTLTNNNILFQKEYSFPNSLYRFDFAILNENNEVTRLIEFDGEQHYESQIKNSGWSNIQKYNYTYKNDIEKNNLAKEKKIPLVRIPYWERENISIDLLLGNKYLIE